MSLIFVRRLALAALATCSLSLAGAGVALAEDPIKLPKPRPAAAPITAPAKTAADKTAGAKAADAKIVLPKPPAVPKEYGYGRIVVLRGLGNVFSRGMDKLAAQLKLYGLPVTLDNHSHWHFIADQIIADYKAKKSVLPIILVGHSLGADASLVMANWLGHEGVPVRLVVSFDGVADISPVNNPVQEVVNYFKNNGYGKEVTASPRFTGTLTNIDLSERHDIDHLNIDKIEALQDETIARILDIMKKKPTVTAKN